MLWIRNLLRPPSRKNRPADARARPRRPLLEALEDRCVPASLLVNTLVDGAFAADNMLSLREAIQAVNDGNTAGIPFDAGTQQQVSGTFGTDDTITFADGLTGTITLTGGQLTLSESVVVTGPGITVSGNQAGRVFVVDAGVVAKLGGLTLQDGHTNGTIFEERVGGAIFNEGDLTLESCTFQDNGTRTGVRSVTFGAAVYSDGGSLTVTGSTFRRNVVSSEGHAVASDDATVAITDSTFTDHDQGDGEFAVSVELGSLELEDTDFDNSLGGHVSIDRADVTVTGGTFQNAVDGSALYINTDSTLPIAITGVKALNNQTEVGAVYVYALSSDVTVADCEFTGNTATDDGGGLYVESRTIEMTDTTFLDNTSAGEGGGFYLYTFGAGDVGDVEIADCVAEGNTSGESAGGGYLSAGGLFTVTNTRFKNNKTVDEGGGLYADGGDEGSLIDGCTFTGNEVTDEGAGGGLYVASTDPALVRNSTFTGNKAPGGNGGGIYADQDTDLERLVIVGNSAALGGGIYVGNETYARDLTVSGNTAELAGGGIYNDQILFLSNVTVSGNSAAGAGGGIYDSFGSLVLRNVTITGNRADADDNGDETGGGLFLEGSGAILYNTIVAGNFAGAGTTADDVAGESLEAASANNVFGTGGSGGLTATNGNQVGIDAATVLDPELKDNGGPTKTHALIANSPAIDAGDDDEALAPDGSTALEFDQRGTGFPRVLDASVDVGAFEGVLASGTTVTVTGGDLVIQDDGDADNRLTIVLSTDGQRYVVSDPDNELTAGSGATQIDANTVELPVGSVTGKILVNAGGGNDALTLDFANGNLVPAAGLDFDGGDGTNAVELSNGTFDTVTLGSTGLGTGSISLDPDGAGGAGPSTIGLTSVLGALVALQSDAVTLSYGAGSETLTVTSPSAGTTTVTSDQGVGFLFANPSGRVELSAANGDDLIEIGALGADLPSLSIAGDGDTDVVNFNGALTFAAGAGLTVSGVGTVNLTGADSDVTTTGAGAVSITALKGVSLAAGSSISTVDGGVTISANQQQTPGTGRFVGIDLTGAAITTSGTGDVQLSGRGGDTGSDQFGVRLIGGATVGSTSAAAGAGAIVLAGRGGAGTNGNFGVWIDEAGTAITSVAGAIQVTGLGGGTATSDSNYGVYVSFGAKITSTGAGAGAATITLDGTGGAGAVNNYGVWLSDDGTAVTSVDGAIAITGQGSGDGSGANNHGVWLRSGAVVSSTGTGAGAATVTIDGTGGAGTDNNVGVLIEDAGTAVTSVAGAVSVTGQGGGGGGGDKNYGLYLFGGAAVSSTGTASGAAVTLEGTGGTGEFDNYGVLLDGAGTLVTSVSGAIQITGEGGVSLGTAIGVELSGGVVVSSTGTGAGAATIAIDGTGGGGEGGNLGVEITGAGTLVTSIDGDVRVTGTGGIGDDSFGLFVSRSAVVSSTGTGPDAATLTLDGTGGDGGDNSGANYGVAVQDDGTLVTSVSGDVRITGTGGTGELGINYGVTLFRAVVSSTGTGADAAAITIEGTGGGSDGSQGNDGVHIEGDGTAVTSIDGAVTLAGTAGLGDSLALDINNAGNVASTGTAPVELVGDSMTFAVADAVSAGGNAVTLRPKTPGTAIDLGGDDAPGVLGLSDTDLDNVTAGTLLIGASDSGAITVSQPITRAVPTDVVLSGASVLGAAAGVDLDLAGGALSFGAGTVLAANVGGTTADSQFDQLSAGGDVDLSGLGVSLSGPYAPATGDVFDLVVASGSVTGDFAAATATLNGVSLALTTTASAGRATAAPPELPAPPAPPELPAPPTPPVTGRDAAAPPELPAPPTPPVTGLVFLDLNTNGRRDPGEPGLPGRTVYLDADGSGTRSPGEPAAVTDAAGVFSLDLPPGPHKLRRDGAPGALYLTSPAGGAAAVTAGPNASPLLAFADVPASPAVPLFPAAVVVAPEADANVAWVKALYRTILGREATGTVPGADGQPIAEYLFWARQLPANPASGLALEAARRAVARGIWQSDEHRRLQVDSYYRNLLGRDRGGDPQADFWFGLLKAGAGELDVVAGILESAEYRARGLDPLHSLGLDDAGSPAGLTALDGTPIGLAGDDDLSRAATFSLESQDRLVDSYYQAYLQRATDPFGRAFWREVQDNGTAEDVAVGVLASDELFARGFLPPAV